MFTSKRDREEISFLRQQVRGLQERNDRLVEALTAKSDAPVIMSSVYAPPEPSTMAETLEQAISKLPPPSSPWFSHVNAGHGIATPVNEKQVRVSAPKSKGDN